MEVVVAIIGSVVTEAGRSLCGSFPSIKNFISFQSNLSVLEKEKKSLVDLQNKVIEDVDYSSDAQMIQWLREIEQILLEVNSVQASMTASNQKLCGCFFNCSERYRFSKETARMLKEIERLLKVGDIAVKLVGWNYLAKAVEHIPGPSFVNQTTASQNLAKVMDLLNNDDVLRIGVWGMGGVGKTTLVKNLNNQLKGSSSKHQFGIVIWATVSQKLDFKKLQIQLAERLNLKTSMEESGQRLAIRLHQRLQKEKFLLILDDVWEKIDLDCLGVPQPEDHTGSKIILTSRSLEVCREMKTDKEVKVDVLNDDESWQLFIVNVGIKVATSEHIEPIARSVARECSGLPLAITIVGAAMRGKTVIGLWKDTLNELRRSVPSIRGIENDVFRPLKWSYDSLQGKNIKPCFLYCCLYPEDFSIDISEIVNCWLGEGLIDEQPNYEDSYNRGIALIENLKDSCLLEHGAREGTVKMHDVVRDVAIWISYSSEDGCKSLVRSGIGLTRISEVEMCESLKRISFMNNKLTGLPDCGICYPKTSSLLLQGNIPLERIPDEFLQAFLSLRVLNLSGTRIRSLPQSILQLGDLRVLLLKDCFFLEELSQLGGLSQLQVLDCSATHIKELPSEMKTLSNLRQLYLSRTHNLYTIKGGIISSFSRLEVLDMTVSAYIWDVKQEVEESQTTFKELQCLKQLLVLSIRMKGIPTLGSEDHIWISRLLRFRFVIGGHPTAFLQTELDGKRVMILDLDLSRELIGPLLTDATSLDLNRCNGLHETLQVLATNGTDCFTGLKSLTIANSNCWFSRQNNYLTELDLLPNLEELRLYNVLNLHSILTLVFCLGLRLSRLRIIEVTKCPQLQSLLRYGRTMLNTKMLEVIKVSFCKKLERLFEQDRKKTEAPVCVVPNLQVIEVIDCFKLTVLPLSDLNKNTIQEIRGTESWWNRLEWGGDNNTKERLQSFFRPIEAEKIDWEL